MSIWIAIKKRIFIGRNVTVGSGFHIGLFSWVNAPKSLTIDDDVYIGKMCSIQCNGTIGRGSLIANNVGIVGRFDHDFRQVGTLVRQAAWVGSDARMRDHPRNSVDIGPDVWIGYGATILSGITIGRGSVIAAGAVVRSDVVAYDIVSGNPAVPIGRRFSIEQITAHERAIASAPVTTA